MKIEINISDNEPLDGSVIVIGDQLDLDDKVSEIEAKLQAAIRLFEDVASDFGLLGVTMEEDNNRILCLGLQKKVEAIGGAADDALNEVDWPVIDSFAHCFGDQHKEALLIPQLRRTFLDMVGDTEGQGTEDEFTDYLQRFKRRNFITQLLDGEQENEDA